MGLLSRAKMDVFTSWFGKSKKYFLEIDGLKPVETVPAVWNHCAVPRDKASGLLCEAPLLFDENNRTGRGVWGKAGEGCIVIAYRGDECFETITRNAQLSQAVGVVLINNAFELSRELGRHEGKRPPPGIPAVCAPKGFGELLSSARGTTRARITRK